MKLPLSWLGQYVDVPPVDELLWRLTEIGHMVDGPTEPAEGGPVVSLEVRQNRPDCLSILGLAREVGAAFERPVRDVRTAELPRAVDRADPPADEDDVCFLRVRGARLDALPRRMLEDLESYGQRPVSPLVDMANYVTIELGQPLHVYDAERIDAASAGSRRARTGESLRLLDGRTAALSEDDLVIADRHGVLALAGVMGGAASAAGSGGDIVVEAGRFRPHLVRRTARRHGIATEASLRSSKLLPPGLVELALGRFLALLAEHGHAGGVELWRSGPVPEVLREAITLDEGDLRRIGGVRLPPERAIGILRSLGFADATRAGRRIAATPPWWRTDVGHPADLIEEILRIHGYARIPPAALPALAPAVPGAADWDQEEAVRGLLCAWGYDEVILDSFLMDGAGGPEVLRVQNPPAGNGVLRPSLLPNMLSGARFLPFLMPERRLFEIGRTFHRVDGHPEERRAVAWTVLTGSGSVRWNATGHRPDYYAVKAEAEAVLRTLGVNASADVAEVAPFPFLPGRSARFVDERGRLAGRVGELDRAAYGLKPVRASYGAELFLPTPSPESAPIAGAIRRDAESFDISVLVGAHTRPVAVERVIAEALGPDLIATRLIDVYADPDADEPRRSLTFRVAYAAERGAARDVWGEAGRLLESRLGATVRGRAT